MTTRTLSAIAAAFLILWSATVSLAASVSFIPSGTKGFIIQGQGMDGVHAIDLFIKYDSSSLSAPTVSPGSLVSGAMFVPNVNTPGAIRVGIVSVKPFSGSGPLAVITFGSKTGAGGITSVTAQMNDTNGAPITAQTAASDGTGSSTPGIPFSQSTTSSTSTTVTTAGTTTTTASTPVYPGTVSMPGDGQTKQEPKPADPPAAPVPPPIEAVDEPVSPGKKPDQPAEVKAPETKKEESQKTTVYSSVLERFRVYTGEKSPAILTALFKKEVAPSIHQQPLVALSDGTTGVKIAAALSSPDGKSPNFALNGATLVSLKRDTETGDWVLEVLPQNNVLKAGLTIMNGNEDMEFPLTVAPPVKNPAISEAGFAAFLKNSDAKATDLNGDGKRDYVDEYIYAANYLVWQEKEKARKTIPAK